MDGTQLREQRRKLNLTQEQLAKELMTTANTIARWERNEVTIPPHLSLALETVERNLQKKPQSK